MTPRINNLQRKSKSGARIAHEQWKADMTCQDVERGEGGSLQQSTGEDFRGSVHGDFHPRYGRTASGPSVFLTTLTIIQRTTIAPVFLAPARYRCETGSTAQRRQRKGEILTPLIPGPTTSRTLPHTGTLTRRHGLSLITCQQVPNSTAPYSSRLLRLWWQTCMVHRTSSSLRWCRRMVMARHITTCRT